MSDEDIINFWKKGWSVEKIAKQFPSIKYRKGKTPSWQMLNRVERVILKFQQEGK